MAAEFVYAQIQHAAVKTDLGKLLAVAHNLTTCPVPATKSILFADLINYAPILAIVIKK